MSVRRRAPGSMPMPAKAIVQSLLAILLWSVLAFLALQLSRMPPFLLIGIALCTGPLRRAQNLAVARSPQGAPSRRLRPLRVPLLPVHGPAPGTRRGGEPDQLPVAAPDRGAHAAVPPRLHAEGAPHRRGVPGTCGSVPDRHRRHAALSGGHRTRWHSTPARCPATSLQPPPHSSGQAIRF